MIVFYVLCHKPNWNKSINQINSNNNNINNNNKNNNNKLLAFITALCILIGSI